VAGIQRTVEAVWRIEGAKLIAALTRWVRDVGLAEELAQAAFVKALERWPLDGVPDKPGAWLMTTAKNAARDQFRREPMKERTHGALGRDADDAGGERADALNDSVIERIDDGDERVDDDLLRLVFISCHPVLSDEARTALTLRLVGGLTTSEIARAFLTSEPTIQQRIVRAKRTLAEEKVPFELPAASERKERLASVLEVIYFIFNEGYSATAGDDWMRPALCEDAQRLARILCGLMPDEAEVHGLAALVDIQASRTKARTDASGDPVLLLEQDRSRWDRLLISRGLAALERAEAIATQSGATREPYTQQAAIAACHARARAAGDTDWVRIATLYSELAEATPSPVIELNRAVAVAMAFGPAQGLALVDELVKEPAMRAYHLLPSVRGDLLHKLGRRDEARTEFQRAASLTQNERERRLLLKRAAEC
jgi:RNA polymerase sigma factor (sigma-70 family)